ncbi:putative phiE125 gp8 family phage protein [Sphingomonas kaistensis]|uniref:Putative phiE125 gp8 family phage protein n=1 Tax=Sphingomonas kaistensis TaxID=298708 RepID=A0A7X6BGJ4_9SPHN|nr:hypothetical protein [Sphingomonas kaistensis]NJC06519.1 putative phiE125 gp8 family phage protein [Sphingomonas kaistensis]
MSVTVVTPPTLLPVTLEEAKLSLKRLDTERDSEITLLIKAMTAQVEEEIGISLMQRTLRFVRDGFSDWIALPRGPVAEVTAVQYVDTAGVTHTAAPGLYTVDLASAEQGIVRNADAAWPDALPGINAVSITYKAGFPVLPDEYWALKAAILTLVRHAFDDPMAPVPPLVDRLLQPHRAMLA